MVFESFRWDGSLQKYVNYSVFWEYIDAGSVIWFLRRNRRRVVKDMKNMKTKIVLAMLSVFALLQAVVSTVAAKAVGDGYQIMGYNAGWIFLGIGVVLVVLFATKILSIPKSIGVKVVAGMIAIPLVLGSVMVFVETPSAPAATVTGLADMEFEISASAVTTDGTYYPDTTFDDGTNIFTVPYRYNETSDTLTEHTDNSTYGDDPRLSFTIKPELQDDSDDDDLAVIYFEVTNPTAYTGSDADNYVLVKTDDIHQARWTDDDGGVTNITGWSSGGVEETQTVTLDLELYETGLAQATVLESTSLTLKFSNKAGTWTESFTVQFIPTFSWDGDYT